MMPTFVLPHGKPALYRWVESLPKDGRYRVTGQQHKDRRTHDQNKKMWAMLRDVSRQVDWYGERLTDDEWKAVFTAALKRQKTVPGIDGGFVVIGAHTSRMTVAEMGDLIELMFAFGVERDVRWTDPELKQYEAMAHG